MQGLKKILIYVALIVMCLFVCVGYATITDTLFINGSVNAAPPELPDVYITNVTPNSSAGVSVNGVNGTVLFASVNGSGTATFTIDFINISDKFYVYERVIDGVETGIDGIYNGSDITYTVSGMNFLDEIAPNGGTLSCNITITVPKNVTAENYVLKFNFIEKTGTEILPGNDEYDVTFKYNNGQSDYVIKVHENEFVPRAEVPVRDGYDFIGWYTDLTYTRIWNFDVDRVTGHTTLYAGWEHTTPNEYHVTFIPNNGESSYWVTVLADSLIPLPDSNPTREGYTFIGWYRDSACTKSWNFDTDKVTQTMVLYGGWEIYVPPVPPDCNITFKPNNGDPDTTIIVLTGEFIPRPTTPVKTGYTFIGWYTDEACTTAWNFEANKVEGHIVLYGGWEDIEYTITFQPNNGMPNSTVTVEIGNLIPKPELPVKDGYVFVGWYTDEECTKSWNLDVDMPDADMTLYGAWEKESASDTGLHNDFLGLVEALLSDSNNCLNDSDLIFDAVMESLTSKKRPKEDAPILHCSVNSVSGGTMSAIATYANSNLTANLHFIFEVDPDPAYQDKRMRLYMYYGNDCNDAKTGDEIMVYQQIVTRGDDGVWYADGTYIGVATVGYYYGGGNAGKDVKTISPYTWRWTSTFAS